MIPVARIYEQLLLDNNTLDANKLTEMKNFIRNVLEQDYIKSKSLKYKAEDWLTESWAEISHVNAKESFNTGIPLERLKDIGEKITALPVGSNFHRLVKKIFEARNKSIQTGKDIDWGTAEALAFASLIQDGFNVRISGQDVERGTFSHRHAHVFY